MQIIEVKYEKINFKLVSDLNTTKRGSGGFGSTGTK
jgi:dUTPase